MKTLVEDNFLEPSLIFYLKNYLLYDVPHYWGQSSSLDSTPFYFSSLNQNNPLIDYIYFSIKKKIPNLNLELLRTYANIQHQNMDGHYHIDDGDLTILLMVTDNPKNGGGEFMYIDKNKQVNTISYKQNRLIIFDSKLKHKGLAYKDNFPRITLAYKNKLIWK